MDQENLKLKIEEWKKSSPSTYHFFRLYIKKSDLKNDQEQHQSETQSNMNNCMYRALFFGSENAHSRLRSLLVQFIALNSSCFSPLVFTGSFNEHIASMNEIFREMGNAS